MIQIQVSVFILFYLPNGLLKIWDDYLYAVYG